MKKNKLINNKDDYGKSVIFFFIIYLLCVLLAVIGYGFENLDNGAWIFMSLLWFLNCYIPYISIKFIVFLLSGWSYRKIFKLIPIIVLVVLYLLELT
jgi:hypothetical protein